MALLQIKREECIGCGACVEVCPFAALSLDVEDKAVVNELCTACRACLDVCPVDALSLPELERSRSPGQDSSAPPSRLDGPDIACPCPGGELL